MDYLNYPMKENTVPGWVVPVVGLFLPMLIFAVYRWVWDCDMREFHDLVLGALMNTMLTACLTSAVKESVGRPRPDFFRRCFPDGIVDFNASGYPICHPTSHAVLEEGRKSFPSGHASWSMCTLAYLSFFLMGKLQVYSGTTSLWKSIVCWFPIFIAVAVGVTRVNDYWHHWSDVVAGLLLGFAIAYSIYIQIYRSPFERADTHVPLYQLLEQAGKSALRSGSVILVPGSSSTMEHELMGRLPQEKDSTESSIEGHPLLDP